MPYVKRSRQPAVIGEGTLHLGKHQRTVVYSLMSHPGQLRAGPKGIRGSLVADPEVAAEAFRTGDGFLVLADGNQYRVKVLAHTKGDGTAYFELWR